jgi:hypothetical protein
MKPLLLPITEFGMSAQHDLQMAREFLFGEKFGYAAHAGALIG